MKSELIDAPHFHDEDAARKYLEKMRWPDGAICPHCENKHDNYKLQGKSIRKGLYKCKKCRKQFTVSVGTLFEKSHVPLHKWLMAVYLLSSSKKGMSSHQLYRMLGVTYKTAWFMAHRIREAMTDPVFENKLGGNNKVVEADETFWGNKGKHKKGARGWGHKEKIFSLVEREGKVRSFHVKNVNAATLKGIMTEQIEADTKIYTDDFKAYKGVKNDFKGHDVVCHSKKEYVRGKIHTNTVEGYFSILKRGLTGVYQHVGANHLKRYVGEFDFRYNNRQLSDIERTSIALRGVSGKRLLYKNSNLTHENRCF